MTSWLRCADEPARASSITGIGIAANGISTIFAENNSRGGADRVGQPAEITRGDLTKVL